MNNLVYSNPLVNRYASKEMGFIFSNQNKYSLWRKLWLNLAIAQQKAGLNITNQQIQALKSNIDNIDFNVVNKYEKETKHEVMAHILAFADVAKIAKPIIHLGETSAFVLDNADIIMYKQALVLLQKRLVNVINSMAQLANLHKDTATLAYTHFQVAQPTTFGKRVTLWLNSFLMDFKWHNFLIDDLKLRGIKGTTGTAASFKELFNNDFNAYSNLEKQLNTLFDFVASYTVTGQTYDRKVDVYIANQLNNIAVSAHKITNDLRLLQHLKEITEPFGAKQVGSSAMPYKQNPMLCERVSSLCKLVMSLNNSLSMVASTQWLERTLDDSANKRISLPQMFLAIDSILLSMHNLFTNLTVNQHVIEFNLKNELPFIILEDILMIYVKNGGDRQTGHEIIRELSLKAKQQIIKGQPASILLDYILNNKDLNITKADLDILMQPNRLTGFSQQQVQQFLNVDVALAINNFLHLLEKPTVNSV